MLDLTKIRRTSQNPCYKNNFVYTGSFSISGTAVAGANVRSVTLPLTQAPDLVDVIFNGPSDTAFEPFYSDLDPRADDEWFKKGAVWVAGDAGFGDLPLPWVISYEIQGINVIIKATYVQTFTMPSTLTAATIYYRIVDYSVF